MKLNNISTALIFHKNVRLNVVQNVRTPEAEERRGTYILDTANLRQCNVANNFVSNSLFIIISQAAQAALQFVLRDLHIYKDFVWELLDRVIYKTLYGNPLDFSKIYDIVMNIEIKLTYLLLSVYLSVLCSLRPFGAILSDYIAAF